MQFTFRRGRTAQLSPEIAGNFRLASKVALRSALDIEPHQTRSDSELVLAAWRKWGADCVRHLEGEFAFVLEDDLSATVFCARDPIGLKSLYYSSQNGAFFAAGTQADLLSLLPDRPALDDQAVGFFLSLPFQFADQPSLRSGIECLKPGHTLTVDDRGARETCYADLSNSPEVRFARESEYDEALLAEVSRAVREATGTDESIGLQLSGGIDSSAISILAARERPSGAIPAYSWQDLPADRRNDRFDQVLIREVATRANLRLRPSPATAADILRFLSLDPCAASVTSTLASELVVLRQAQADGVSVILSGWGGDQCVTFPGITETYSRARTVAALCLRWRTWGLHALAEMLRHRFSGSGSPDAGRSDDHGRFLNETYLRAEHLQLRSPAPDSETRPTSARQWQIWGITGGFLTERMASWAWASAKYGIEHRYPLLDARLVRFVFGLPEELYRPGPYGRDFVRRAFSPILPRRTLVGVDRRDRTLDETFHPAMATAFRTLIPRLSEADPERAQYVDMARLRADAEKWAETRVGPIGLMMRVFSFLNVAREFAAAEDSQ